MGVGGHVLSPTTNIDLNKCRHIQMPPHLSGYIHYQSHNSYIKTCVSDDENSFRYSELKAKLSLNSYKSLLNAILRGVHDTMEVTPALPKM